VDRDIEAGYKNLAPSTGNRLARPISPSWDGSPGRDQKYFSAVVVLLQAVSHKRILWLRLSFPNVHSQCSIMSFTGVLTYW